MIGGPLLGAGVGVLDTHMKTSPTTDPATLILLDAWIRLFGRGAPT